jgi:hypothetical protein
MYQQKQVHVKTYWSFTVVCLLNNVCRNLYVDKNSQFASDLINVVEVN